MGDAPTTTTSRSRFTRLGNALTAIVVGQALVVGSFFVLALNESRAVHETLVMEAGAGRPVPIPSDQATPENDGMVQCGQGSPSMLAWILRPVGFVMMFAGFLLVLPPLCAVVGVIPFLGRVAGTGPWLLSFALALPLSLGTISVPWVAYRPVIGVPLVLLALASAYFVIRLLIKARQAKS